MPDRPPVKFAGQLPEGTLNGLGVILPGIIDDEEMPVHFVGTGRLKKIEHVVDTGIDWAVLRIISIEVLTDGKIPADAGSVPELVAARRSERIGDNPIDFDGASDAEWARLAELRRELADYAAEQGMSDVTVGEDVLATVPGAGAGWRDDVRVLGEYLRIKGRIADPPAGDQPGEGTGPS